MFQLLIQMNCIFFYCASLYQRIYSGMVKAWLYLCILGYFLCVLFSLNVFFIHLCISSAAKWLPCCGRCFGFVLGLYPFYVQILLIIQHLSATCCYCSSELLEKCEKPFFLPVWTKEIVFCNILLLIVKTKFRASYLGSLWGGSVENTVVGVAYVSIRFGTINMQINHGSLQHWLPDACNSP